MQIQVTRPFWHAGAVLPLGQVLALPDALARELIHNGKATPCAAPATDLAPELAPDPVAEAAPQKTGKRKRSDKVTPPNPLEAIP